MNTQANLFLSLALTAGSLLAAPSITKTVARQYWPWSADVNIDYLVSGTGSGANFVTVDAYKGDTFLCTIPQGVLSGDVIAASDGAKRVTFNPTNVPLLKASGVIDNFNVRLSVASDVLYLIVDLTKSVEEAGQVTYLTAYDLTNSASEYGSWAWGSSFHTGTNIDSRWQDTIVWTGVTNDSKYATTCLVLRYLPAGTFAMGSPDTEVQRNAGSWWIVNENRHTVTLTKAMFAGVFELTYAQYALMTGGTVPTNGTAALPVSSVSWETFRGTNSGATAESLFSVTPDSAMGQLQALTGIGFNLPTEAQWEYACRAGSISAWNNGTTNIYTAAKTDPDSELSKLAWYGAHLGNWPNPVGLLAPNGWGLYDTHGNMQEMTLDIGGTVDTESDRGHGQNPAAVGTFVFRGGANHPSKDCRAAARNGTSINSAYADIGCRVFYTLP